MINAAASGTWTFGDLTINRIGFGAMRLTGSAAFDLGTPSDRKCGHLGLSNIRTVHLSQARAIAPVVCVQNRYGLDHRRAEALVQVCGQHGIAFVPFFALAGSAAEQGGITSDATVDEIAEERGATAAQIRLAWTLAQGEHVLAIPGTGNPEHLAENIAAGAIRLSDEELARLSVGNASEGLG